jgi:hypothetical protein
MDNNSLNKKSIGNNKKTKSQEKVQDQNIKNVLYFLSDKKNNAPLSIIKSFLYTKENNELSNDAKTKKVIKVNTDNYCKTKNKLIVPGNINNAQNIKKELNENDMKTDDNMSINEKISKFETRIGNLLDVIDNFEKKFINSPETQRIKDQFKVIMDKKIYKNRISNDYLHKSWVKTDFNDDLLLKKDNSNVSKNSCIMDIKNINININNNNYENNYFITQPLQNKNSPYRTINKKQIFSEKKFNIKINNSSNFKKSKIEASKKKPKCISNDLKNKINKNQKDKSKVFKLPLDFIINNNSINHKNITNNRYNKSQKEIQIPLTDRREKKININIITIQNKKNKLKSANKKKQNCLIINKNMCGNNDIGKKPFIKKEGIMKSDLFNSKKNLFNKNSAPSTLKINSSVNNTINSKRDYKDKKLIINFNLNKNKESSTNYINFTLNKKKIIKRNNVISFFNNQNNTDINTQNSH